MILRLLEKIFTKIYIHVSKPKKNKIVFDNFLGKGYGDNPKYICDELIKRQNNLDLVWLSNNMDEEFPKEVRVVKYGTQKALRELSSARIWVDNVRNMYKPPKKPNQIYLQTWHGSYGPKPSEGDALNKLSSGYINSAKKDGSITDAIISDCDLQTKKFETVYWLNEKTEILKYGMPRNDSLIKNNSNENYKKNIKRKLEISEHSFIVLYAPTFRDDRSANGYVFDFNRIIRAFEKKFNTDVFVLLRLHPNDIENRKEFRFSDKVMDVSSYPDAQDLSLISDCLITDYSTMFTDFLILKKNAFFLAIDYDLYSEQRGILPDYFNYPYSVSFSVDSLIDAIEDFDVVKQKERIEKFAAENKFYSDGHSSEKIADWIMNKL